MKFAVNLKEYVISSSCKLKAKFAVVRFVVIQYFESGLNLKHVVDCLDHAVKHGQHAVARSIHNAPVVLLA